MNVYKRPEMELDPAKLPGQIINRPPQAVYLRDVIRRIEQTEGAGCCHQTVIERCDGCPYATINS